MESKGFKGLGWCDDENILYFCTVVLGREDRVGETMGDGGEGRATGEEVGTELMLHFAQCLACRATDGQMARTL